MSDLRDATDAIETAIHHLEQAEKTAPRYSLDALVFVRHELHEVVRRLGNFRRVVGDVDTPIDPDSLGPCHGGAERPRGTPIPAPSDPDRPLGGGTHGLDSR